MRIQLVHYQDTDLGSAWSRSFAEQENVEIVEGDICAMTVDAIVSPANSFGFMDAGLDLQLSERFGPHLQEELQRLIKARPVKELLVGEAIILPTGDEKIPWLISAPTMRVPMHLRQSVNAYLAMKAILSAALKHGETPKIGTVAIPGLGTGNGCLPAEVAAEQMFQAYLEIGAGNDLHPDSLAKAQRTHISLTRGKASSVNLH